MTHPFHNTASDALREARDSLIEARESLVIAGKSLAESQATIERVLSVDFSGQPSVVVNPTNRRRLLSWKRRAV